MAEERLQRRLAAILAADVVGYSRLMGIDETGTLKRLKTLRRELIDPAIAAHAGRIVKLMGDGATGGIRKRRRRGRLRDRDSETDSRARYRRAPKPIRSSSGSASMSATSSSKTTISSATASISPPGSRVSPNQAAYRSRRTLWRQVQGKVSAKFVDGGEQSLKNIARPFASIASSSATKARHCRP